MEESLEEAPAESSGPESTAKAPDDSRTDSQEDNWENQNEEEVDDQTDHKTAEQAAQRVSVQTDHRVDEPTGHRTYEADLGASNHANAAQLGAFDQHDQRMDEKTSGQGHHDSQVTLLPEQRAERTERRRSSQAEGRAYEQIEDRLSNQSNQRTSEQSYRRLSVSSERRASGQIDHGMPSQAEQRTSEHTGYRLANQIDTRASIETHHEVSEEAPELAEQQTADQAYSGADHLTADNTDSGDEYKIQHLIGEENYSREDYLADFEAPGQYDNRIFTQFGEDKEYQEAEFRVEACKFEAEGTDHDSSLVSAETDTESVTYLQAFDSFNAKFTSNFQAEDQAYSQTLPYVSSKLDYITGQEETNAIETKPDDIPEYQEGKVSLGHSQPYGSQFPPIVYEDPYQVALQYMEKHNILQIFQITENLVYEKPEDPLRFMLYKVQEMIKNRDKT